MSSAQLTLPAAPPPALPGPHPVHACPPFSGCQRPTRRNSRAGVRLSFGAATRRGTVGCSEAGSAARDLVEGASPTLAAPRAVTWGRRGLLQPSCGPGPTMKTQAPSGAPAGHSEAPRWRCPEGSRRAEASGTGTCAHLRGMGGEPRTAQGPILGLSQTQQPQSLDLGRVLRWGRHAGVSGCGGLAGVFWQHRCP